MATDAGVTNGTPGTKYDKLVVLSSTKSTACEGKCTHAISSLCLQLEINLLHVRAASKPPKRYTQSQNIQVLIQSCDIIRHTDLLCQKKTGQWDFHPQDKVIFLPLF